MRFREELRAEHRPRDKVGYVEVARGRRWTLYSTCVTSVAMHRLPTGSAARSLRRALKPPRPPRADNDRHAGRALLAIDDARSGFLGSRGGLSRSN